MIEWKPEIYGKTVAELLIPDRLMDLGPGKANKEMRKRLNALTPELLFESTHPRDKNLAAACVTALWLYHDFLEESHTLSQDIHTAVGSYWHGILHRREPDYENAKYWFRRVGRHPIYSVLRDEAAELAATEDVPASARFLEAQTWWDPFAFIDLCEACEAGPPSLRRLCQHVQQCEWRLLFEHCYRGAAG